MGEVPPAPLRDSRWEGARGHQCEQTANKPRLRDSLQHNWPWGFKMSVMKEKDKQRKCPKLKKTEEQWQLNAKTDVELGGNHDKTHCWSEGQRDRIRVSMFNAQYSGSWLMFCKLMSFILGYIPKCFSTKMPVTCSQMVQKIKIHVHTHVHIYAHVHTCTHRHTCTQRGGWWGVEDGGWEGEDRVKEGKWGNESGKGHIGVLGTNFVTLNLKSFQHKRLCLC